MKNKLNKIWSWIKRHKIWSTVIAIVVLGVGSAFAFGGSNGQEFTTVAVERGSIKEEVSVTGNVKPLSEVDLAFERGGRVSNIAVTVGSRVSAGQYLASVSNADLVADVDQAKANLKKVQAETGNDADKTALDFSQAKAALEAEIKDSYTKADDAVRNKIYSLFTNPAKYQAQLSFTTGTFLQEDIEEGKDDTDTLLEDWERSLDKFTTTSKLEDYYATAQTNLKIIKDFLDKCALAVNGLGTDSEISQTQIDTWKLNISTARTNINSGINILTASFNDYKTASLSMDISEDDTLAEQASVEQVQAQVASAEAALAKSIIRSPISGVVTDIPMKLGEIVPANQKAISVISYGDYQVETFVPEADIAKVKTGDKAKTTLDAYGSDIEFETSVIKIDPAATVIDGVPTYKVTLQFTIKDERVRSGMTANLDILTNERIDVLIIPSRAIKNQTDGKYVLIINTADATKTIEKKVVTGLRGSDGMTEIISGLTLGEKVVVNSTK